MKLLYCRSRVVVNPEKNTEFSIGCRSGGDRRTDSKEFLLISPYCGYRELQSYKMSEIVYDATLVFCNSFIDRRSRIHDQMAQAMQSGKQNIAEGIMASSTSKKMEPKLVGATRASLKNCNYSAYFFCNYYK